MNDLMGVEKLAHWEKLKALVLDSVSSPITKRLYNMALNEFLEWFQQGPRPGFTGKGSDGQKSMRSIAARLHALEVRRIEVAAVANGSHGAKELLLAKLSAIRERLDAAKDCGEYIPTPDPEEVRARLRAWAEEYSTKQKCEFSSRR